MVLAGGGGVARITGRLLGFVMRETNEVNKGRMSQIPGENRSDSVLRTRSVNTTSPDTAATELGVQQVGLQSDRCATD